MVKKACGVVCAVELWLNSMDLIALNFSCGQSAGTNLCGRILNKDVVGLAAEGACPPAPPPPAALALDSLLDLIVPPCRWLCCCECVPCDDDDDDNLARSPNGSPASRRLWKGMRVGRLDFSDRELEDVIAPEDDDPPRPPVPLLLHLKSVEGKKRGKP